jgi:predicted nucleic acid-binding protein
VKRISHILDTSAILAHYFGEPGADVVAQLWADDSNTLGISAVSATELKCRLVQESRDDAESAAAAHAYLDELTVCIPVDRATAELAWQLRLSVPGRLPLVDSLIAAAAREKGAILVHRDQHLAQIPGELVEQIVLPGAHGDSR